MVLNLPTVVTFLYSSLCSSEHPMKNYFLLLHDCNLILSRIVMQMFDIQLCEKVIWLPKGPWPFDITNHEVSRCHMHVAQGHRGGKCRHFHSVKQHNRKKRKWFHLPLLTSGCKNKLCNLAPALRHAVYLTEQQGKVIGFSNSFCHWCIYNNIFPFLFIWSFL